MFSKKPEPNQIFDHGLTKYPSASLKELLALSFPLILSLFSQSLMSFCNRLFLSYFSIEALEGYVSAQSLIALFQTPSILIASAAQVFIGRLNGLGEKNKMGQSVWQMAWWAFLSPIWIVPLGIFIEPLYFGETSIAEIGVIYFRALLIFNFLFPLGSALASFYIGQGHTKSIFFLTLTTHFINIILAPLFIFGIKDIFDPLGILGASIANILAQAFYCLSLLFSFLQKKNREIYNTSHWHLNKKHFFEQLKIGFPGALSKMVTLFTWAGAVKIVMQKGGDYLLALSIGSSIHTLFAFLNEGIGQGIIPIASYLIGKKDWNNIWKLMRSSYFLLGIFLIGLSIPCLIYPQALIAPFLRKKTPNIDQILTLKKTCYYLWLYFFTYGFGKIGAGLLLAARDTTFLMIYNLGTSWLVTYVFIFYIIQILNWPPETLWFAMAMSSLLTGIIYFLRLKKERWKKDLFRR